MPRIKKEELERVYNSIYKEKKRVLPANQKKRSDDNAATYRRINKEIIYLIDGYNLLYSIEEIKKIAVYDLMSARDKIIDIACDFQGYTGKKVILVFDAYRNNIPVPVVSKEYNIELVYTKADQTADMYIEQKAEELSDTCKIFVVTSDGLEQLKIFSSNCLRISANEFMHRYENLQKSSVLHKRSSRHQPLKELRRLLYEDDE